MNTDTTIKRVLLYGDSLVYGKKPGVNGRWPADTRFSGILQAKLGSGYEVLEEGLRGRNLKGENTFFPERDGLTQFGPIIGSHLEVDLVVIVLGSNDCNATGIVNEQVITDTLDSYREKIRSWSEFLNVQGAKLLIVTPPAILASQFDSAMKAVFGDAAPKKQAIIEQYIREYCERAQLPCVVSSQFCEPAQGGDGIHLDEDGNTELGNALAEAINRISL